ncbi:hypothetical protein DQ238_08085 [Geodermatophilus sp. TF02-6]|nr:hypothetical protein DQ238_08085 [Geodermatophilus sp. TF02-6]
MGAPDASLTGCGGVAVLAELEHRLGVAAALDTAVGPIKQRDRGLSAGQFLLALAQAQMCGETALVGCDRRRADAVAEEFSAVPTPASTTAATLARRLSEEQWLSVEDALAAVAARVHRLLPARRRAALEGQPPTIDLDTTDTEVYGRRKQGVSFNHCGQRVGRTHLASWAQASLPLAADLRDGRSDPRTYSTELMQRALAGLARIGVYRPGDPTAPRPRFRDGHRLQSGELARAAVEAEGDFSIGVRRGEAVWAAVSRVPAGGWAPAKGMPGTEVAVADYAPAGWPQGTVCIVRRVRHNAADISADPRARWRRTIPKEQLALALDGEVDAVYGYSFIATNLPADSPAQAVAIEAWHRGRTDVQDRFRDAKHGAALLHLPCGDPAVNTAWLWAALLALALSAWL